MTLDQAVSAPTALLTPVQMSTDKPRPPRSHRPRIYRSRHRRRELIWTVVAYLGILMVLVSVGAVLLLWR